jgi:signal transduction histidine kinase
MKIAPKSEREEERILALREYSILDSEVEKIFDEIVALASFICDTPISTITLIDENRQWFKAKIGLDSSETPRDVAFCAHTILQDDIMIVNDATKDDRFHDNPLVLDKPDIRFYAGMPLITPSGFKIGTLCVIDTKPKNLSENQNFALRVLSNQVIKLFELRKKNDALQKMHEMHSRLLSIIGHDLRGPINSIDGLLLLAERYKLTVDEYAELLPKMRQMIDTTNNLLLNLLHWSRSHIEGKTLGKEGLPLKNLTQNILTAHAPLFEVKKNTVVNKIDDHHVLGDRNMTEFILRNLILNANKFMGSGVITLTSKMVNGKIEVCIADNGSGIADDISAEIFAWGNKKRIDGTHGEKGSGLGLPMCKEFAEQQGGKIWFTTEVNKGTSFHFTLPKKEI